MASKRISLERINDCPFCELSLNDIGYTSERNSSIIYKSGNSLESECYAILQPNTPSDPKTGFSLQLMPLGHLESFSDVALYQELAQNMGCAQFALSNAMSQILEEEMDENKEIFKPGQIIYGKANTPENTVPHIHVKMVPFSGDVAQVFPTDAEWGKKQGQIIEIKGNKYVLGNPVSKNNLTPERHTHLKNRLIEILSSS